MKKWDPAFYDINGVMQHRTATEILSTLTLTGSEKILDVGSGNGKISYELAQRVPEGSVVGVDISTEMTQFAQTKYKANNLLFTQADVLNLSYYKMFDVVVSFWTLSWVADQALALRNILNALKPGGVVLMMYPLRHDAYDVADEIIKRPKWKKYFEGFTSARPFVTETEYRALLGSVHDATISVTKKEIPCRFESYEEMRASIRSWMSYLDKLENEKQKEDFLDDFIEEYLDHRNLNSPTMYFSILEIRAQKFQLDHQHNNLPDPLLMLKARL